MPTKPPTHRPRHSRAATLQRHKDYNRTQRMDKDPRRTARWQKLRRMKLARHPLCQPCLVEKRTTPAKQVHHIVPIRTRPDLAFVLENLLSVCTACHARLEAQERRG